MLLESNRSRIFKLQKQSIRIIKNAKCDSHADPLFKKLKLLKLVAIIEHELFRFAIQIKENIIPTPILALFLNNWSNIVLNVNMISDVSKSPEVK